MADRDLEDLFERFRREGDAGALGNVFDATAADLLRIARRVTRDRAEAEDVLQSTFLAAIQGAAGFERGRSLRPWLVGILVRQAGLARRRRDRGTQIPADGASSAEAPAEIAAARELADAVAVALSQLSESDREVLVPLLLDGRRAVDIARELERRPDTVHMRIHRGLARLRRLLPTGFALGLVSMRAEVVRAARVSAGRQAAVVSSTAAIGGVLLVKKIVLGAAALVVVTAVGWLAWPDGGVRVPESSVTTQLPPGLEQAAAPRRDPSDSAESAATPPAESRTRIDPSGAPMAEIVVVQADGSPASGIAAAVVDAESSVRAFTADAEGRIRLEATRERVDVVVGRPNLFPRRVQLLLEPGTHRIELASGRAVSGRVQVDGMSPAQPMVLRLTSISPPLAGLEPEREIARALGCEWYDTFSLALETAGDGAFRASGLPQDWLGMLCVPRSYTFPDAPARSFGNQNLHLEAPVEGLTIDIERMPCVRGRVVEADGGLPVPEALLMCSVLWSSDGNSTEIGAAADASGRFEVPLQEASFRSLRFTMVTDAEGRGGFSGTFRHEDLGPDLDLGELRLERPPSRDVSIVVRDAQGSPIAQAIAVAGDLVGPPTDRAGRATLASVPIASKELCVAAHGYWAKTLPIPDAMSVPLEVVLDQGNELAVEIAGIPGDVAGRMKVHILCTEPPFANSGDWLPGWMVREVTAGRCGVASPGQGLVICECDDTGRLVLEDLRPGMPMSLQVLGGFEQVLLEAAVPPLDRSERRLVSLRFPEPACVLSGRTLADDGAPLPRVGVVLGREDGNTDARVSDREGRFAFSLRDSGDFHLTAEKKGWAAEELSVSVRETTGVPIEVRLQRSRHVAVDVVGPRGERIPGVRLEVRPPAGFVAKFAREDFAGRFHFDDLPPIRSVLRLSLAGETQERPIDPFVPELRIEMPGYGRVEFTWDPAVLPARADNVYPLVVLRPIGSSRAPLTHGNLQEPPGAFPVVWTGDYTLGLELYSNATENAPERWTVFRPAVPLHVQADRTEKVTLGP